MANEFVKNTRNSIEKKWAPEAERASGMVPHYGIS